MRQAILEGAHQGARGETNLAMISEVTQKSDELPSKFYDWLCDACCRYTPVDPEAPANQSMINTAFIQQSAPDVHQKLQKTEGFTGANIYQLISLAAKVVANQKKWLNEKRKNIWKKRQRSWTWHSRR
jgi:hypothetical protein